jgi:hypothetical protein
MSSKGDKDNEKPWGCLMIIIGKDDQKTAEILLFALKNG